jgi:hypothetical protein
VKLSVGKRFYLVGIGVIVDRVGDMVASTTRYIDQDA